MLRNRLKELEAALLPAKQDLLGNYPPEQVIHTEAYLVLAHAAFERALESECRKTATEAKRRILNGQHTTAAIAIASFYGSEGSELPNKIGGATVAQRKRMMSQSRLEECFDRYDKDIEDNNGIKQYNLIRLLAPIGLDLTKLSTAVLTECDNFGELRGNLAHGKAQQVVDPFSEKRKVDQLEVFFGQLALDLAALL